MLPPEPVFNSDLEEFAIKHTIIDRKINRHRVCYT